MKIILIDDDPISLFLSENILKNLKNIDSLVSFEDPKTGLSYVCNEDMKVPTCLLLDINMPIMDGWEFLKKLQETEVFPEMKDLKICMLTSSIDERDKAKALTFPFVSGFIVKPLTSQNIIELLAS